MNVLRACLDRRVLAGLAAIGVAVYLVAPDAVGRVLPLLILAACPVSMVAKMVTMRPSAPTEAAEAMSAPYSAEALARRLAEIDRERSSVAQLLAAASSQSNGDGSEVQAPPGSPLAVGLSGGSKRGSRS